MPIGACATPAPQVPGAAPALGYPRDRSERFTNELVPNTDGQIYKYRYGPQPVELGGQRALDFVLDNPTLQVQECVCVGPSAGAWARGNV
eukprot:365996-Chlamydomonas_euryale.AAC.8